MREFSSGILGCIICVLALMGTILGGFVLDIDKDTRETTDYNYITDITGLFDTENTPKYIDYNPSTNFTGYPEQTVNYVNSSVPNNYRYIANSGLIATVDYNSIPSSSVAALDEGNMCIPFFLNYTGTRYNLGTATTWNTVTYNVIANGLSDGTPCVTTFYQLMTEKGFVSGTYNLTDSGHPIIIYNGTFTTVTGQLYNSGMSIEAKTATIDDNCFPTKITYNYANPTTVTAYNGSTQLWTARASDVYVIYDYGIIEGGSYTHVNVNTQFNNVLNTQFTKTDTSFTSTWTPITISNSSVVYNYPNVYIYYTESTYNFGEIRRFDESMFLSRYNATLLKDPNGTNYCVATAMSILNSLYGSDAPTEVSITITIENNGNPFFMATPIIYPIVNNGTSANLSAVDRQVWDQIEFKNVSGTWLVRGWKNGTQITSGYDYATDWSIIWGYTPNNQNSPNINTTFSSRVGVDGSVGSGDSYSYGFASTNGPAHLLPYMAFNYTGTSGYDFGSVITDRNLTYNGYIPTFYSYYGSIGGSTTRTGPWISTYRLSDLLHAVDVPNSVSGEFEIVTAYPSNVLMFFLHNQNWTQTTWSLNNNVIKGYATTVNDDNLPTRFTWNAETNWVTIYRDDTLLYSDDAANIQVVYTIRGTSGANRTNMAIHIEGYIEKTGDNVSGATINNSSDYAYSTRNFTPVDTTASYNNHYFINATFRYTGSAYNNIGSTVMLRNIDTDDNKEVPYVTTLDKILTGDYSGYSKVTMNIAQGTHPIFFYTGSWTYTYTEDVISDYEHGYSVTYHYHSYTANIGDNAIATKIEYNPATETCTMYRNNLITYVGTLSDITVIFQYDIRVNNIRTEVTDQSATLSGIGMPIPLYAYMDPTKGITLNLASTTWENGYENSGIDIVMVRERAGVTNELTITADTSSITVRTVGNTMTAYVTKYDGTTVTKTIGTWAACQIHIDAAEGTISLTPLQGPVSYTNNVPENATTTTWTGWYNGGDITTLTFTSTAQSMRFNVTNTSVFLNTYGVVMQDPSINVPSYFPEYEEWRLNFYSFALVGESMTVNGQTFDVDEDQKITVTGSGKTITSTLSNVYVTEKDNHTYFTFVDGKETVDLGETVSNQISFNGRWYFTTGLYEGVDGVEDYYNWTVDGMVHATIPQLCLIFIGTIIAGLIICKAILKMSFGFIDWVILIFATIIALIIAGGSI